MGLQGAGVGGIRGVKGQAVETLDQHSHLRTSGAHPRCPSAWVPTSRPSRRNNSSKFGATDSRVQDTEIKIRNKRVTRPLLCAESVPERQEAEPKLERCRVPTLSPGSPVGLY